jgi:hypothetical protein
MTIVGELLKCSSQGEIMPQDQLPLDSLEITLYGKDFPESVSREIDKRGFSFFLTDHVLPVGRTHSSDLRKFMSHGGLLRAEINVGHYSLRPEGGGWT